MASAVKYFTSILHPIIQLTFFLKNFKTHLYSLAFLNFCFSLWLMLFVMLFYFAALMFVNVLPVLCSM